MKSQNEKILRYMKENGSITSMEAFRKLGITRLSARIYDLRKAGYQIDSHRVYTNRYGEAKHYDVFTFSCPEN